MTRDDLRAALENPNVAAFLRVLRSGESHQEPHAYRIMFGGSYFVYWSDHPRQVNKAAGLESSAAGAYQFLTRTWDGLVKQYGFPDFSPDSQDCGAVALIHGRGALDAVKEGRLDEAIRLCNREWASLPGSPYGQPVLTLEKAREVFAAYGGTDTSAAQPVPTSAPPPPKKEVTMAPAIPLILQGLAALIPQLGSLFGGSEVAQRNVAAAGVVAKTLTEVTNSVNLMEAEEKIRNDPNELRIAKQAVADIWPSITEVGGGVKEARAAQMSVEQVPFWKQGVFWITVFLLPLVYIIVVASIGRHELIGDITSETRAQVIGTVLGVIIGGIVGFFYGTSSGSQRKTDVLAAK